MAVFNFALPTREEDHNWCPWLIVQVSHDNPNAQPQRVVSKVPVVNGQDDPDMKATIALLRQAFQQAGYTVAFIHEAQLGWMDL